MGHVHLNVAEIPATVAFYRDVLGFGLMAQLGPQAAFLSAGGYHHHIGANTWESAARRRRPPGTATLRHATIVVPDADERDRVLERVGNEGPESESAGNGVLVSLTPPPETPSRNALLSLRTTRRKHLIGSDTDHPLAVLLRLSPRPPPSPPYTSFRSGTREQQAGRAALTR